MLIKNKNGHFWRGKEITAEKYNEILSILHNRPTAPEGYAYRLTESDEWELCEQPVEEIEEDPELATEEALDIIVNGGGGGA